MLYFLTKGAIIKQDAFLLGQIKSLEYLFAERILKFGTRYGSRTRLSALKGQRPKPIDEPSKLFGIPGETRTPTNSFGDCYAAITPRRYYK